MDDGSSSKMSIEVRRYILLFAIICTGNITKSEELADECRNVEGLKIWELFWNVFVRDVMVYCGLVYIVGFLGGSIKLRYLNRNF